MVHFDHSEPHVNFATVPAGAQNGGVDNAGLEKGDEGKKWNGDCFWSARCAIVRPTFVICKMWMQKSYYGLENFYKPGTCQFSRTCQSKSQFFFLLTRRHGNSWMNIFFHRFFVTNSHCLLSLSSIIRIRVGQYQAHCSNKGRRPQCQGCLQRLPLRAATCNTKTKRKSKCNALQKQKGNQSTCNTKTKKESKCNSENS